MDYVHSEIFSAFFGFQDVVFKSVVVDDGVSWYLLYLFICDLYCVVDVIGKSML